MSFYNEKKGVVSVSQKPATTWSKLYAGLNGLYIAAIINLLFLIGVLLGFGIFGLAPAYVSCLEVGKRYHQHRLDKPIRTFFKLYKKNMISSNQVFLVQIFFMVLLWVDSQLILDLSFFNTNVMIPILAVIQLILLTVMLTSGALLSYYQLKSWETIKKSIQFSFYNLAGIVLVLLWVGICFYGSLLLPGLIPFLSFGLCLIVISGIYLKLFENNEVEISKLENKEGMMEFK